jgi:hypothetical protein
MKGKKIRIPNIIKKELEVVHACDIGNQPVLNKKKMVKVKKKPLPLNKDLFVMNNSTSLKRRSKKKSQKRLPKIFNMIDAHNQIDITSSTYKRQESMARYRKLMKKK